MTVFKRSSIVHVNFNLQKKKEEIVKIRPAVIVSETMPNDIIDLVSVAALTTPSR